MKDRYNNNLRRGDKVKDLRPETHHTGELVGTGLGSNVLVKWEDSGEEELVNATDISLAKGRRM